MFPRIFVRTLAIINVLNSIYNRRTVLFVKCSDNTRIGWGETNGKQTPLTQTLNISECHRNCIHEHISKFSAHHATANWHATTALFVMLLLVILFNTTLFILFFFGNNVFIFVKVINTYSCLGGCRTPCIFKQNNRIAWQNNMVVRNFFTRTFAIKMLTFHFEYH